ncbi:Glycoside hydrolase family 3 [Lasiodiplodia theobromae]|uniref:beta-glucosidase n=1 Tax=Lasiodiplodia theobromae TaxID=45133 RepID=A0A5N5D8U3_9PEZI|nr:Glycoside hydrolase family 3 [Lasiodiplodia theobromae]KAB2574246.1 putative beta-glucosidase D [Lasiodiplodia theobromae]KAF4543070.1 Glycoside hydrolase family 3 [Lasiodiplodia theobromae]
MRALSAFGVASALVSRSYAASNSSTNSASILSSGKVQLGDFESAYQKAKAFVSGLSNADKISIITGGDVSGSNLTWTALENKDGSSGINYQYYVSGFSMDNALAMTWDRDYFEKQNKAVGREFYLMGYNLINGPECGPLGRTPWGGRQAEAYSPDPYLSGSVMSKAIAGMNSAGVVAGGRHFLLNEQETNRSSSISSTTTAVYTSNADDKTIHELYLWPFQEGVKAGMAAVMCAMSRVNGTLSCENSDLVSGLLKSELGFPGMVFPDVNSQSSSYGSANAGLDYGSSSYWTSDILEAGITNGSFTQARLDDMAVRNIIGYYYVGLDDGKQPEVAATTEYRDVRAGHAALIREIGANSLVLLKNNNTAANQGLPLNRPRTMSVFGAHAGPAMAGPNQAFSVQGTDGPVYQGHLASGSGSGQLSFSYLITPFQSLSTRAAADGSMIRWILNDTYSSSSSEGGMGGGGSFGGSDGGLPTMSGNSSSNGTAPGGGMGNGGGGGGGGGISISGQGTAVTPSYENYAEDSEVCLVFLNSFAGEGGDREELNNADQDTLVTTIASSCNNTVVIINTVGPRLVDAWIENENVTAVVYGGLLGQESGNAIADVLYGDVNPSGKLINTIAKDQSDYPVSICYTEVCDFSEGVYIDYRHFDKFNVTPRYPFGHGLSYTTFSFGDVGAQKTDEKALSSTYPTGPLAVGGKTDLFDEVIRVTTTVENTGDRDGAEVAQLYVAYPSSAPDQPPRQLRGFEKVKLAKGERKDVTFSVRRKDISYWDTTAQEWAVAKGRYTFSVGASSRDLKGEATVTI